MHQMRFADAELQKFHDAWKSHREHVDKHIERFCQHVDMEENRWHEVIMSTKTNHDLIQKHIEAYRAQEEALNKLIELYETGQAGIKIGHAVGKFAVWLTSLSGLAVAGHFIIEHFFSGRSPP